MGVVARILVLAVAMGASWWILRRVRRQRMSLGTAVLFLGLAGAIFVLGLGADTLLDPVSTALGVSYPPTLLFLVASVVLLVLVVHLGGKVEKLNEQVRDLAERYARDHAIEPHDTPGGPGVGPSADSSDPPNAKPSPDGPTL